MIGESILQLREGNTDESIKSYEYDEYQQITGTQLNSARQITITIENQDQFLHLHNSYLLIEGNVLKADSTRYADVNYPSQATSLRSSVSYSPDYSKGCGLIHGWTPDINANAAVANTGFAVHQRFLTQSPDPKGSLPFQCGIYSNSRMTTQRWPRGCEIHCA